MVCGGRHCVSSTILGIIASGGAAAAATSFESIATATGTGSSGTITFSSIPGTFKHLQIRHLGFSSPTLDSYIMRVNGATGSVYSWHYLDGGGSSASASGAASQTSIAFTGGGGYSTATNPAVFVMDILDYASTSKNKTIRNFFGRDANGSGSVDIVSGLYQSTSAITSITFITNSSNWTTDTTFALYGIKESA